MLRPRRWAALAAAALAVALVAPAAPAAADSHHPCPLRVSDFGSVVEWGLACLDYFGEKGAPGGTGGGGPQECTLHPNPWGIHIVCLHDEYGWWSNAVGCYVQPEVPQPRPGHWAWSGNDPADGLIYRLRCPWLEGVDGPYTQWPLLRFFPAHQGAIGRLVAEAIGQLVLTGPEIRMAPDPGGAGLVGLPVWMWTEVTERSWAPAPLRLSAQGWTVVVEAGVDRIVWEMGNGDTVVCDRGPGTPYQDEFGAERSPDCGYDGYLRPSSGQPDGVYQVTATTHWVMEWRVEGASARGTETAQRQASTTVRIHELQVMRS